MEGGDGRAARDECAPHGGAVRGVGSAISDVFEIKEGRGARQEGFAASDGTRRAESADHARADRVRAMGGARVKARRNSPGGVQGSNQEHGAGGAGRSGRPWLWRAGGKTEGASTNPDSDERTLRERRAPRHPRPRSVSRHCPGLRGIFLRHISQLRSRRRVPLFPLLPRFRCGWSLDGSLRLNHASLPMPSHVPFGWICPSCAVRGPHPAPSA